VHCDSPLAKTAAMMRVEDKEPFGHVSTGGSFLNPSCYSTLTPAPGYTLHLRLLIRTVPLSTHRLSFPVFVAQVLLLASGMIFRSAIRAFSC
jgi:hypothetical protein